MTRQHTNGLGNRINPIGILALTAAAGMVVSIGACGRRAAKSTPPPATEAPPRLALSTDDAYEPTDRGQAIDTSLAQLAKGGQGEAKLAATPDEVLPDAGDTEIASRIDQSARILDDYFAQVAAGGDRAYDASLDDAYDPASAVATAVAGSDAEREMIDARFAAKARRPVATVDGGEINTGLGALAGRTMPTAPVVPAHVQSPALADAGGRIPAAAVPQTQTQVAAHVPDEFDARVSKSLEASPRIGLAGMSTASGVQPTDATDAIGAIASTVSTPNTPINQGSMQPVEVYAPLPTIGDPAQAVAAPALAASTTVTPGPSLVAHRAATPEQRKDALVDELISILNQMAKTSDEPYRVGLALAGLETLSPDAMRDIENAGLLMPSESEVLLAARDMFRGLVEAGATADAGRAMDVLDTVHDRLNESAPLKISSASLCTRVSGYGQFQTFPANADGSYDFTAGRRQPIIVYVEVDRFGRTPVVGGDGTQQWDVALTQELQIYHAGDNLLVTSRPAEQDHTVSRTKMRDYYLINQTYLPETLGVGRYHLKVVMRDEHKNAVAERIIPFQIVAQPTISVGMGS